MGSCHSQEKCKSVPQPNNNGYTPLSNKNTKLQSVTEDKSKVLVIDSSSKISVASNVKTVKTVNQDLNSEQVLVSAKQIHLVRYTWFELHREVIKVGAVAFVK